MTDKLIRIVTLCEHGWERFHFDNPAPGEALAKECDGGSVVDLTRQEAIDIVSEELAASNEVDRVSLHDIVGRFAVDALLAGGSE